MLRVQLFEKRLGAMVMDDQDPIGVNEITQTIKRSTDNEGVTFEVILDLSFIKNYRRFILQGFQQRGGIDMDMLANTYRYNPNCGPGIPQWSLYSEGRLNASKFEIKEDRVTTNIEQIGFQRRVLNLLEREVDLETTVSENGSPLPAQFVKTIQYHSKTIIQVGQALPQDPAEPFVEVPGEGVFTFSLPGLSDQDRERMVWGNVATMFFKINDLNETYQLPWGWSDWGYGMGTGDTPSTPAEQMIWFNSNDDVRSKFFPMYTARAKGNIRRLYAKLNLQHRVLAINESGDINVGPCDEPLANIEINYFFQHRDSAGNIKNTYHIGSWDMSHGCEADYTGPRETHELELLNIPVEIGDEIACFATWRIFGHYHNTDVGSDDVIHNFYITPGEGTEVTIDVATSFVPTPAKTIMLYEAFKRCIQYYTNQDDCFYSDLLGRTDLGYSVDGDFSLIGITNGNNLRGRSEKAIFASLNDLLDFVNCIACVGFGFDKLPNGKEVLRLERKEFFYKKDLKMLTLSSVYGIKRTLDIKRFYNQVNYGYETKVDIGLKNAVDEFNTKRNSSLPVVNTKNALKISTKMVTGGYQIEAQRRLSTSTEDGKLDDANFAISMVRDGDSFKPKTIEGYELVENLIDPPSAYNLDLAPARTLRNWYPTLASSLVYALPESKTLKFLSGEGNYALRTKKTGEDFICDEQGEVDLSEVVPWYTGFNISFYKNTLDFDQFVNLKTLKYGYIEAVDFMGVTLAGFISDKGIEHDENKGTADFELMEMYVPKT